MKTRQIALLIGLTAVLLTPLALAAPEDGPRRGRGGFGGGVAGGRGMRGGGMGYMLLGRMGEELNLTEAQRGSIEKIMDESRTALQEQRQAVADAMQALNEATEDGDEAAIKAAGKAAGEALTQQALKQAEITKQVKAVLTDEQKAKWEELRTQMRQRMEEMRQQRRQRRPDGERPRRQRGADDADEPENGSDND